MNINIPVITLDGPSGTGKGTLCNMLANSLGWHCLDSGIIYRVLAFASEEKYIKPDNLDALVDLSLNLPFRIESNWPDANKVFLHNQDITLLIRQESCGQLASKIAAIEPVRLALLERLRAFAQLPGLVTDGRDMGTVVFPNAALKIYLDASIQARALRRYEQLKAGHNHVNLSQVLVDLEERDSRDKSRSFAPLVPAEDAVLVDTSDLNINEVFDKIRDLLSQRGIIS